MQIKPELPFISVLITVIITPTFNFSMGVCNKRLATRELSIFSIPMPLRHKVSVDKGNGLYWRPPTFDKIVDIVSYPAVHNGIRRRATRDHRRRNQKCDECNFTGHGRNLAIEPIFSSTIGVSAVEIFF